MRPLLPHWKRLDFGALVILVLIAWLVLTAALGQMDSPLVFQAPEPIASFVPPTSYVEAKGRALWLSLYVLYIASVVSVSVLCARATYVSVLTRRSDLSVTSYRLLKRRSDPGVQSVLHVAGTHTSFCMGFALICVLVFSCMYLRLHGLLSEPLLQGYLSHVFSGAEYGTEDIYLALSKRLLPGFEIMMSILATSVVIGMTATASGAFYRWWPNVRNQRDIDNFNSEFASPEMVEATPLDVAKYDQAVRVDLLKRIMYAGSSVLVLGIAVLSLLFSWAAGQASGIPPDLQGAIGQIYIVRVAVGASLMLVTSYVAAAVVLGMRAERLQEYFAAGRPIPFAQRRMTMTSSFGIDPDIGDHIIQILAALAPIVSGGIATAVISLGL